MLTRSATRVAIFGLLALGACTEDEFNVEPIYNHANGRVMVRLSRGLEDGEQLFVRSRRGTFGTLDCAELASHPELQVAITPGDIEGPYVEPSLTKPFYGPEWAGEPTAEMLASLKQGTDSIIDACVVNGGDVVKRVERDLFAAWDAGRKAGLGGKADDPHSGEVRINSPEGYGERCVAELGEIPFFKKLGEGNYETYDCLESTAIPMTVTKEDGSVESPEGEVDQCDNPQYIYSLCEAGPRVASRTNDEGTRWVLLCRKSKGGWASNQYNDIAMLGHNPFTGKTCFFQNALYSKTDGGAIPHPADKEKSKNLWSGVHGGLGEGIQCSSCHDADPIIHTPWIDGAKDTNGRPIIPKMGVDPDMPLGALDSPYDLVNMGGQGWKMEKQLVSPEANECLKCHRMGAGRWTESWIDRLGGTDTAWKNITTAKFNTSSHKYWMPPDTAFAEESDWNNSASKAALDFIADCGNNPTDAKCKWADVPHTLGSGPAGGRLRNPVNGSDDEIAERATMVLGMNKNAPAQQCAECHAPNQTTLHQWQEATDLAVSSCLADSDSGIAKHDKFENVGVGVDEMKVYGPFDVASGATIDVKLTGTGDGDLYVKRGETVTDAVYDCRPYNETANETCNTQTGTFNAAGPAKFWVGVKGTSAATVDLNVTYKQPDPSAMKPREVVDCFRLDPARADSPFVPSKLGIYSAAAHLGWFQDTFKGAYVQGQNGATTDTWALEYGKFKSRTSMPKGNHPRFSQEDFDVVAEWFARGLPRLTTYIPADMGPTSCTPSITPAVAQHADAMRTQGWGAINRAEGMTMYGCAGAASPAECLRNHPAASQKSYATNWTNAGNLRVIRELAFNTYYWTRSSADGRFIGNGATGGDGGVMSDLQTNKDIRVRAAYDPGFFPDGKGWVFQGTPIGAGFCTMGLLTENPDRIDFSESQCSSVGSVSLYQHLGAGLGGADYMVINSQFTSDNPSSVVNRDPSAGFGKTAQMKISPMVFDGTHYVGKPPVTVDSPFEGDSVLSPSTKLIVNRFGNEGNHLGYIVRKMTATPNGPSYNITTQEIGRYCTQGAKPAVSFDERFMVTHHYVGEDDFADLGYASAQDPAFRAIVDAGSANIIVIDLVTGVRTRITTMAGGQYALFPHFRSDGWFYFLVRDRNNNKEYMLASDFAIR